MSQTNGTLSADETALRSRRKKAVLEARALQAEMHLAHAQQLRQRQQRLTENSEAWEWISGWQDVIDRMRGPERDLVQPVSTAHDRRYGDNWPFWRSWTEHSRIRAASRILCGMSNQPRGLIKGLSSYVIKTGHKCRAQGRSDSAPPALVGAVQAAVDEFDQHNYFPEMQQEIFARDRRDGESFTHLVSDDHGMLEALTFEPEHVGEPPNLNLDTDKYGIITPKGNTTQVQAFWVAYDGDFGSGEEIDASEVLHTKVNVDRAIKRGLPDFSFDTYDAIKSVSRLLENMSEGAAIQASIALLRSHEGSGYQQVAEFQDSVKDYEQFNGTTGRQEKVERYYPGKIVDAPKGMTIGSPAFASNPQNFVAVAQAVTRYVGMVWNAPEGLASGDYSNNNYASALVAEAPFARRCEEWQEYYSARFLRAYKSAVKAKCDARKLVAGGKVWSWEEVQAEVELTIQPPHLTVRDPLQKSQQNQIDVQLGTNSPQNICQEEGRDYEKIAQDLEEHQERTGGSGPALGDDPDEGGSEGDDPFGLSEAVRTDKRGYKICFDDNSGKRTKCGPGEAKKGKVRTHQQVSQYIAKLKAGKMTAANVVEAAKMLASLTVAELRQVNKTLGTKAGGEKTHRALMDRIKERALGVKAEPKEKPAAKEEPSPAKPSSQAIDNSVATHATQIAKETPNMGGVVKVPDLVDRLQKDHPGMTREQAHGELQRMAKEDKLTLQLVNDRHLEPRADEMIKTPRGVQGYVVMKGVGGKHGKPAKTTEKSFDDLLKRSLASATHGGPDEGLIDISAAQKLSAAYEDHKAGRREPLADFADGIANNKAGRRNYPDDDSHAAANALVAEMLAAYPDDEVKAAAEADELPGLDGGSYPAFFDKAVPGYAAFLRDRLGAKPRS